MTAETYQLSVPGFDLVVAPNGDAWVPVVDQNSIRRITPDGAVSSFSQANVPTRVAIDSTGALWSSGVGGGMAGTGEEVLKYSTSPSWSQLLALPNDTAGAIVNEIDFEIAVDGANHILLSKVGRLYKYDAAANSQFQVTMDLSWTTAIDTDGANGIWVGGTYCVNPSATFGEWEHVEALRKYDASGTLQYSLSLVPDDEAYLPPLDAYGAPRLIEMAVDPQDNLWVSMSRYNVVKKLNSGGTVLGTFPVGAQPTGVAVATDGSVWVANQGDNTVTKLASDGGVMGTFPVGAQPTRIAAGNSGIWVLNSGDNSITRFH